jgi:hypothetical protein
MLMAIKAAENLNTFMVVAWKMEVWSVVERVNWKMRDLTE